MTRGGKLNSLHPVVPVKAGTHAAEGAAFSWLATAAWTPVFTGVCGGGGSVPEIFL